MQFKRNLYLTAKCAKKIRKARKENFGPAGRQGLRLTNFDLSTFFNSKIVIQKS